MADLHPLHHENNGENSHHVMETEIYSTGEKAITVHWKNPPDENTFARVFGLYRYFREQDPPWCKDIIPTYTALTIIYDVVSIRNHHDSAFEFVKDQISNALVSCSPVKVTGRLLKIPVCYDPLFGLDLLSMSRSLHLTIEEVIALHTATMYRVYMIGFLPGFPYMGFVPEKIAVPRLARPRKRVPAGSVGIAGRQTGIYSIDSPGGWNIIGRTPVPMFHPYRTPPVFLQPGDEVKFVPISRDDFEAFEPDNYPYFLP